jgi:hypothetical protein
MYHTAYPNISVCFGLVCACMCCVLCVNSGDVPETESGGWQALRALMLDQQEVSACTTHTTLAYHTVTA